MMPTLISGWPNRAVSDAMMRSQLIASSHPAPSAYPLTAAMRGVCSLRSRSHSDARARDKLPRSDVSMSCFRSAPAANTCGPPVTISARMSSSASSCFERANHLPEHVVAERIQTPGRSM